MIARIYLDSDLSIAHNYCIHKLNIYRVLQHLVKQQIKMINLITTVAIWLNRQTQQHLDLYCLIELKH